MLSLEARSYVLKYCLNSFEMRFKTKHLKNSLISPLFTWKVTYNYTNTSAGVSHELKVLESTERVLMGIAPSVCIIVNLNSFI